MRAPISGMPLIEVEALWLATEPIDMRAGADRLLARVVHVFGAAQARHGYLFANARGTRMKLLVHDGSACGVPRADSTSAASSGRMQARAQHRPLRSRTNSSTPSCSVCRGRVWSKCE